MVSWIIGAFGAMLVAGAAYRKRSLSFSGMIAAFIMGTVYFGAGNAFWFGILLIFFISSSLLSKLHHENKAELELTYDKTGTRDAGQVFANGGMGMLLVLLNAVYPLELWELLFIGVMATVTSDTWATELGTLAGRPPRSVLTGKVVPAGTSGGVSLPGSLAAAAGGALIGAASWLLRAVSGMEERSFLLLTLAGLLGGLAGAFADSFLGATVQRMNRCTVCGREVEASRHCGRPTVHARGWRWMNNDAVNALSTLAGGAAALLVSLL
ncbi:MULTISPECIES: DUF92 domain-containing protein [unclassified Paenibacillus]|uniref:DUF92 domain-containing protein n=1 Tax=unclassified Paenibacillus TaxID=185978 RepID=UPI002406D70A|nr:MULTISPECIES: DUF92 domain-containing protein [unclassified Paenibacillus]MDF9842198.1 uncharacterized protein (TIGR00297 family) [Paenibacillus sp. PastF-2]MDF9848925.1 uncharacterized protein (TIGR00297 family) [Paenibacillus sp. PastM-2]MDF9855495.1 uncharacterized protein (TIGR00297 family) [Paenibacillus sp. PastF-1]MDH6480629.1 uncharacterized protein (TIGR00297 family) [Paenibacillus sp. PastH-2]MDH6508189.1 uncharacterized protein (TIGR00297 family) [Paenibacillus sp. PastM-3]